MNQEYGTILVAIDCSDDSAVVLARAARLAQAMRGTLHVIHVVEPLALAYGADVPLDVSDLQANLTTQARQSAEKFSKRFEIPPERIYVELGSIEKTIQEKADQLQADLIVIGSHTRSGLALLFGSTARGLVPGAHCDVLAIKVGNKQHPKQQSS